MIKLLILAAWVTAIGSACSCAGFPSVGEAWENADAVFLGEVASATRVTVMEPFKGPARGMELEFPLPRHFCTPRLKAGTRQLMYAHRAGAAWEVYGCGRGSGDEAEDLLYLRNLPRSAGTTRLSGTMELYEGAQRVRPLAGLAVEVSGPSGARMVSTNADGVYEVYGLPPGDYTVAPQLPAGLQVGVARVMGPRATAEVEGPRVGLRERSTASLSFIIREDHRISGRVLDPAGKAMRGVCVELETLDGQRVTGATNCTQDDGVYLFENMPRGPYRLVLNRAGKPTGSMPFGAVYYPGIVTVGPDGPRTGVDFRLARLEKRAIFTGQVQFRDGAPIAGAAVELVRDGQRIERTRSGDTGHFEVASLEAGKGELRAFVLVGPETEKQCPHWQSYIAASTMTSAVVPVALETDQAGLVLRISVSSCPGQMPGPGR